MSTTFALPDPGTAPAVPDNAAYVEKYGERIAKGRGSPEEFAATCSVAARFRPGRVRGF